MQCINAVCWVTEGIFGQLKTYISPKVFFQNKWRKKMGKLFYPDSPGKWLLKLKWWIYLLNTWPRGECSWSFSKTFDVGK